MKFIQPAAEWWPQESVPHHIARVGRVCYKATGKQPPANLSAEEREAFMRKRDEDRCKGFWESGHRSMYRHGTAYFYIKNDGKLPGNLWPLLVASPYIDYAVQGHKVWISTNMQLLCESPDVMQLLAPYGVDEDEFVRLAVKFGCEDALWLLRMTFAVTTQISTSRELNRTSPNAIAEQSTRYCNLNRKGGVQIVRPHWMTDGGEGGGTPWRRFVYAAACRMASLAYKLLLRSGMKPEDARGVLPLDTYTVAVYTYNIREWQHIINLRYYGRTGKPHPNARLVCGNILRAIVDRMQEYIPNFDMHHEDTVQKTK